MPFLTSVLHYFPHHSLKSRVMNAAGDQQHFIVHKKDQAPQWKDDEHRVIKDDEVSRVIETSQGYIVKFVKSRTWHDYLRMFFGTSKISRELRSCARLAELGLRVPQVHEYGMALVPSHFWGVLGYYVMQKQPALAEAKFCFSALSKAAQQKLIGQLVQDLKLLRYACYVYRDLSFRNMMADADGELFWIDTNTKSYHSPGAGFTRDWNKTLSHLLQELTLMTGSKDTIYHQQLAALIIHDSGVPDTLSGHLVSA